MVAEATHQVRRLRNRPSIALWCGNNEVQAIHQIVQGDLSGTWGEVMFHEDLPAVVAANAPGAIYWPGSPWGEGQDKTVNGIHDGDRHAWEVWHGLDLDVGDPTVYATRSEAVHFRRYARDNGAFISEFGIHATPELNTLRRWLPESDLVLRSAGLDHHNKDEPKDKGWVLMSGETGEPTDLAEYIDFSMACQAEGLKFGVEHYRRRQPKCSGTFVWQFNDPWPGLTWSVIDYDLVPKAGYYFLQRAYRPVVATFRAESDELELWVTNASTGSVAIHLDVGLADNTGQLKPIADVEVVSAPHRSELVWRGPQPDPHLVPWVTDRAGHLEPNRLFLSAIKDLQPRGQVTGTARRLSKGRAEIELTATGYAYLSRVTASSPGIRYSGNYLDLLDGQRAVIELTNVPDDFDVATLEVSCFRAPASPQ